MSNPDGAILYLSDTYEGSVHDKKICDEYPLSLNRKYNYYRTWATWGMPQKMQLFKCLLKAANTESLQMKIKKKIKLNLAREWQ